MFTMLETPQISQLSEVISQSIGPAFILGAVASFISVLVTRLNRIVDRCRTVTTDTTSKRIVLDKVVLSRLNERATLINRAIFWAIGSAFTTLLLMIVAFISAFLGLSHERGVGLMFLIALLLFCTSLTYFGREISIVMKDPDNFD
jgi:hypothetical protein